MNFEIALCPVCKRDFGLPMEHHHVYPKEFFEQESNGTTKAVCRFCHKRMTYILRTWFKWFQIDKKFCEEVASYNEKELDAVWSGIKKFNHELNSRIRKEDPPNLRATEFSILTQYKPSIALELIGLLVFLSKLKGVNLE